ncbi:MAG: hypothetical protein GXY47_07635 [Acidobacteria bacterium]|nr:hypothetical protein [Acidobacteriota bacterium]
MAPDLLRHPLPRSRRLLAARGLLPLPPADTLALLVALTADEDPEVARLASATIDAWPARDLAPLLRGKECAPAVLGHLADPSRPAAVLEALIENPATPGPAVAVLSGALGEPLVGRTLDNRRRVLECPAILDGVRRNPRAGTETLRVLREIETDFMGTRRAGYAVAPSSPAPAAPAASAAPAAPAASGAAARAGDAGVRDARARDVAAPKPPAEPEPEIPPQDLSLEGLPPDEEDRRRAIGTRLSSMPVREKIRYALFGTREVRAMLIADTNKEVARAVLRSPKMGDSEVESIAAMRTVGEEILREIGGSREWTKSYTTVHNLVRNPKTPVAVSQRLMFRLRNQDLGMMAHDRSLPDAVRHNAARLVKQRTRERNGS